MYVLSKSAKKIPINTRQQYRKLNAIVYFHGFHQVEMKHLSIPCNIECYTYELNAIVYFHGFHQVEMKHLSIPCNIECYTYESLVTFCISVFTGSASTSSHIIK